jgi:thioredoxin 1
MMPENVPVEVKDADFDETVLKAEGIAVVDFWAPWCGPCHTMAPGLEAFAADNPGKVKVFKLDVDDNPKIAERYEIRSIPTVIFFREGEMVETNVGAMSQTSLQEKLDGLLGS